MAPKGGNAKKESGRAKKADNEAKKQETAAAERERKEADKWQDNAKSSKSKEDKEEKRKAELARKAENARLLAEEEAAAPPKPKPAPKASAKKPVKPTKPAGPGAIAAGGGLGEKETGEDAPKEIESYSATGIDNAIDLLEVVTAKKDKASVGQQAAGIERHPERRFKVSLLRFLLNRSYQFEKFQGAFEAYKERELPNLKVEHPGLRLQQYQDLLYKQFQKSPENPFNQVTLSYDATKDDKVQALKDKQESVEKRLRA
ncbi:hypothetical protein SERLA73DRAFT_186100 [Serpula lacrymans var. lacrymans S7.3]|uniref:DUF1014-domain-containing protein n=2 Tax=Serpula lacrymans var. lacrymans TaxID=341189 RepID=F8Q6Y5_SERL3|nr:uncharacterized protein SERLADRAFT_451919 [Serpula lacrymans var. lacrymans S7.9]EGN96373.1 hypothetical protein SERLA73DRAFT_186100 [Serpula lacrymans var. lacrymans S7.3]EGO21911.1 hypothetical protein SERLADRAFT_451919 [Serpula lacrymans var. lacrymans S7.9]